MDADTQQPKAGTLVVAGWVVGSLVSVYLLLFAAIRISGGGVARALVSVGVSPRLLDFLYGWLAHLLWP